MEPVTRRRLHEQVVDRVKDYIVTEALQDGDRLPTETALALQLGVGRRTIREALRVLEGFGIVESRPRIGTRVKSLTMKPITDHLRFSLDVQGVTIEEMWRARQAMECAILYEVVHMAEDADFARIARAVAWCQDLWSRGGRIAPADLEFHVALVAATHNRALEGFAGMLHDFFATVMGGSLVGHEAVEEHAAIYEALRARDTERALAVMREHVRQLEPNERAPDAAAQLGRPQAPLARNGRPPHEHTDCREGTSVLGGRESQHQMAHGRRR